MSRLSLSVITIVGTSLNVLATPSNFPDPLMQPAQITSSSIHAPVMAIARAGSMLVAVGQRGHILRATSSTSAWSQVRTPVSTDIVSISFSSSRRGWAVGHDGVVLSTDDGGATWKRRLDGNEAYKIQLAYYGYLAASGDATAQREASRLKKNGLRSPAWPFLDVWFKNPFEGFLVGAFGVAFHTSDGGKTWVPLTDRLENPTRMHLYAIRGDGDEVYIAGEHGTALKLDRESGRFRSMNVPYKGTFFGIVAREGRVVVYGLNGHAFLSEDSGQTWKALDTSTAQSIVGHTVTPEGDLLFTTVGGKIFRLQKNSSLLAEAGHVNVGEVFGITAVDERNVVLATSVGPQSLVLSERR